MVFWEKRSGRSQALRILTVSSGVDHRDVHLWLWPSAQTVYHFSVYSPARPGMWMRHRMSMRKRAQAHLWKKGGLSREGKGLVHGHTAHWGPVCTMTLDILASRELHLELKDCKLLFMHMHVHGSISHNSPHSEIDPDVYQLKIRKTNCAISIPYNSILFIHKKRKKYWYLTTLC